MIHDAQVQLAKTLWDQARTAAMQSHQAWELIMNSQKTILESMRSSGTPFALAADQFAKLMEFQSEQYKAALEHMDKMSMEYQQLLAQNMPR